ncbi:Cap-specific mRNA (nucleoside-2-O-)-methyltransferase [uncultured virus]|nr:Cap-specific mRNA (nucleoside-2-O-)-methyltransferase [uncultured virus]
MAGLIGGVKLDAAVIKAAAPVALMSLGAPQPGPDAMQLQNVTFDRNKHFTVGDGDPRTPYSRRKTESKLAVKWGQFKLLMEEVQFFNLYWDPSKVPRPVVVYVGSATGTHIAVLADMFPWFTFHLHDPREHDPILKGNKNIHIHKGFFNDEEAKVYAERKDVFLIVDIRSTTYKRNENVSTAEAKENEAIVASDMDKQMAWTRIIRPVKASLKFRLPYSWDFVKAQGKTRAYLDGLVYLQQWGPVTTTETRLVPHDDLRMRDWDYQAHEEMMFHHNTKVRAVQAFLNPITGSDGAVAPKMGLLSDYDSVATTVITMEYLEKFGVKPTQETVLPLLKEMIRGAAKGATTLFGLRVGSKSATADDDDND